MSIIIFQEDSLILAPLSGYSDLPFRRSALRYGCVYAFTEMIDAGSLVFGNRKTLRFLDRGKDEQWLGAQLIGSDTATLSKAAKILSDYDFEVIDFNLGCPAPKVARKREGAALAKNYDNAVSAFASIIEHSSKPCSAKIRILDKEDPGPTLKLVKGLENAGAAFITIHGRIAEQFYTGPVSFKIIAEAKQNTGIPIIVNGGIYSLEKYREILSYIGPGPVMIAGGAMGNPWIFREIIRKENFIPPTPEELAAEIQRHISEICEYYGIERGLRISRKIIFDYMRGRGYPASLKNDVIKIKTMSELGKFLCEIRKGPSEGYFKWLEKNPNAPRKIYNPFIS
jgi:tRNA-dihydrouridine synthase B